MNIILLVIYSVIDVLVFPRIDKIPVIGWSLLYKSRVIYPVYRFIQFLLFAGSVYWLWSYTNWYYTAGYIAGFYFLTTDLIYYICRWEWQALLQLDESKYNTYWLNHITQSGFWLFKKGFSFKLFIGSAITGIIILIFTNLI